MSYACWLLPLFRLKLPHPPSALIHGETAVGMPIWRVSSARSMRRASTENEEMWKWTLTLVKNQKSKTKTNNSFNPLIFFGSCSPVQTATLISLFDRHVALKCQARQTKSIFLVPMLFSTPNCPLLWSNNRPTLPGY